MAYEKRTYRGYTRAERLVKFEVAEKETDLLILAESNLAAKAIAAIKKCRAQVEKYIADNPRFLTAFSPLPVKKNAAPIIKAMASASRKANVGPMAAVAGAVAEFVGKDLLECSDEIIVENGGDIFLKIKNERKVGVYAGNSPFSEKIALMVEPRINPFAVCASSGTVGHSFSFGKADAVVIISSSACLADAAATAIGNIIQTAGDIDKGLALSKKIKGIDGILIIKGSKMGAEGKIKLTAI